MNRAKEREISGPQELDTALDEAREPFIVRALVSDWPLVEQGKRSARAARQYLLERARTLPFAASVGAHGHSGRIFYADDMAMNFESLRRPLAEIFAMIDEDEAREDKRLVYLTSVDMRQYFKGVREENFLDLGARRPLESLWIGTRSRVAAHNDFPENLACCCVGRRRFVLFPPDQFANLHIGPLDNTPAGRPISMVDFHRPDLARFPRFAQALEHAQLAELEPGDAVFVPSLWWHHVEGLDDFNIMANYWWRRTPAFLGQPQDALFHAILAIRDLPEHEKSVWRAMFERYVFENDETDLAHIPAGKRGILDPLTPQTASRLRAFLLRALNR